MKGPPSNTKTNNFIDTGGGGGGGANIQNEGPQIILAQGTNSSLGQIERERKTAAATWATLSD